MTAPEARPGGLDSNVRGILVLVAALAVGTLLLFSWGNDSGKGATGSGPTSSPVTTADLGATTTSNATTSTTPASNHTPSEVTVLVLNGSGQTGAAAANSTTVGQAGYTMGTPGTVPSTTATTTVYYADGYKADAIAVAGLLGRSTDVVKPLSSASLSGAEGDANVVVVLGTDIPPVSTTTTAATGITTTTN